MARKALPISDEIRRMALPFEVKSTEIDYQGEHAGEFTGYAAGIHNIDRVGDMILPGAFKDDLPRFLADGVVCWQHDWMNPIGVPLEASEDGYGLMTRCRVSKTSQGIDAMTLIRDKVVKKLSIGYRVESYEWVDRAGLIAYLKGCGLSEQRQQGIIQQYDEMELDECFLLKKIKLYEYSPVTVPANPNAIITDSKNLGQLSGLTFQQHSEAALSVVQGLAARVKSITSWREQHDKKANPIHAQLCEAIAEELGLMADDLEGIAMAIRQTEPKSAEPDTLLAEFLRLEARSLGVAA
jgi:HK97 family phage prohead protease